MLQDHMKQTPRLIDVSFAESEQSINETDTDNLITVRIKTKTGTQRIEISKVNLI